MQDLGTKNGRMRASPNCFWSPIGDLFSNPFPKGESPIGDSKPVPLLRPFSYLRFSHSTYDYRFSISKNNVKIVSKTSRYHLLTQDVSRLSTVISGTFSGRRPQACPFGVGLIMRADGAPSPGRAGRRSSVSRCSTGLAR